MKGMREVVHAQDLKNPAWSGAIMNVLSYSVPAEVAMSIHDLVLDEAVRPYLADIAVEVINAWNEQHGIKDRWWIIDGNLWKSGPDDSIVRPGQLKAVDIPSEDYNEGYIKKLIESAEQEEGAL